MDSEKQYIKAFNNGYLLAQCEPQLLHTVTQNLPLNNYLEGLFAGKSQFEYERDRKLLLAIEALRDQYKAKDKGLNRE